MFFLHVYFFCFSNIFSTKDLDAVFLDSRLYLRCEVMRFVRQSQSVVFVEDEVFYSEGVEVLIVEMSYRGDVDMGRHAPPMEEQGRQEHFYTLGVDILTENKFLSEFVDRH